MQVVDHERWHQVFAGMCVCQHLPSQANDSHAPGRQLTAYSWRWCGAGGIPSACGPSPPPSWFPCGAWCVSGGAGRAWGAEACGCCASRRRERTCCCGACACEPADPTGKASARTRRRWMNGARGAASAREGGGGRWEGGIGTRTGASTFSLCCLPVLCPCSHPLPRPSPPDRMLSELPEVFVEQESRGAPTAPSRASFASLFSSDSDDEVGPRWLLAPTSRPVL